MAILTNPYVLLAAGVFLLLRGADELVKGSSSVASRFGISKLVVGLTVVAFGTSAPEFAVNVIGALKGETSLVMGNIIGSNIANLLLILGVIAILAPPKIQSGTVWREIPFSFLAVVILAITANSVMGGRLVPETVTRGDGLLLLLFFGMFIAYMFARMRTERSALADETHRSRAPITGSIIRIVLGGAGLYFGGNWIVDGAKTLAFNFGLSPYTIGATIVAIGTSLPELAASVVAARKGESDLAVGNVVGSNIFNIFWILGITAAIKPIPAPMGVNVDMLVLGGATALLFAFMFLGTRLKLQRSQGFVFILLYAGYIISLLVRN